MKKSRIMHSKEFKDASALYESFTGHHARPFTRTRIDIPSVAFVVGTCDGLLYTTVRDGEKEKYIHHFKAKSKPVLAVSPDGLQLFLIGGNFQFTDRGIVDK